jgi:hypothetical protein
LEEGGFAKRELASCPSSAGTMLTGWLLARFVPRLSAAASEPVVEISPRATV